MESYGYVSGSVAITAVGATPQGKLPGKSANQIAVDALQVGLAEIGIDKSEIDGLITCRSYGGHGVDTDIGRLAGLRPAYSATLDYGTCNFSLQLATMAVSAGLATTVAILYGTNQKTAGNRFTAAGIDGDLTQPYGFSNVGGLAALAFRRHQHLYGTTEEQLGWISVSQREWARLNPTALFQNPLSIDDYLAQDYLISPLRRPDMTMISDGGACIIVTTAERARSMPTKPVYILGAAQQSVLTEYQDPDDYLRPWIKDVADRLYRSAGVSRDDVDALYIQDPFSPWVLQMLEWYGFCPVGEGGRFLAEGHTRPGGSLPVNTNGGQLSEAYMWGFLHIQEAVRQLRGEAGPRQIKDARIAQYASTMTTKKAASTILGSVVA